MISFSDHRRENAPSEAKTHANYCFLLLTPTTIVITVESVWISTDHFEVPVSYLSADKVGWFWRYLDCRNEQIDIGNDVRHREIGSHTHAPNQSRSIIRSILDRSIATRE